MQPLLLSRDDAAIALGLPRSTVDKFATEGLLVFRDIDGNERTSWKHAEDLAGKLMSGSTTNSTPLIPSHLTDIPGLDHLRQIPRQKVGPKTYISRNGLTATWPNEAWAMEVEIAGKTVPLLISIERNPFSGAPDEVGAVVCWGTIGHGPRPIVEFARTTDYPSTRLVASVIKEGGRVVRPTDPIPPGYNQLQLAVYSEIVIRPWAKVGRCVVAREDDLETLALHALLRCRQKGWI